MAATLIGVAPAMFGGQTQPFRARESFFKKRDDTSIPLSILKTLLEKPNLINLVLDVVDVDMFEEHSELFQLVLNEDYDHPLLVGLSLSEEAQVMTEEELLNDLKKFLRRFYERKLKEISRMNSLSLEKKVYLIRKLKTDIIPRLKRGELVTYDLSI